MSLKERIEATITYLGRRRRNYRMTFTSSAGQQVLMDLAKFCRANETTFNTDARIHAALEGRREVWLRIQQHLNLTDAKLFALYNNNQFNVVEEDEDNA